MSTRGERGSVAPLVLGVVALGLVLAAAATRVGVAAVARARAETAADTAALAAADALATGRGPAAAAEAARATAAANGARLVWCRCAGHDAAVEVELAGSGWAGRSVRVVARAAVDTPAVNPEAP
ncbi:MAG: Rv3654c family TadE-like protein [Acidimicrobiia bacterium]